MSQLEVNLRASRPALKYSISHSRTRVQGHQRIHSKEQYYETHAYRILPYLSNCPGLLAVDVVLDDVFLLVASSRGCDGVAMVDFIARDDKKSCLGIEFKILSSPGSQQCQNRLIIPLYDFM